jgi:tetratricopeptide (TPR) repeat protein
MSDDSDKKINTDDIDLSFGEDFEDDFEEAFSEEQLLVPSDDDDVPTSAGIDEKTVLVDEDEQEDEPDQGVATQDEKTVLVDDDQEAQPSVSTQDEKTMLMGDDDEDDVLELADLPEMQNEQTMAVDSFQEQDWDDASDSDAIESDAIEVEEQEPLDIVQDSEEILGLMDSQEISVSEGQVDETFSDQGAGGQTEMLSQDIGAEDFGQTVDAQPESPEVSEKQPAEDEVIASEAGIEGLFADMNEDVVLDEDDSEYDGHTDSVSADTEQVGQTAPPEQPKSAPAAPIVGAAAAKKSKAEKKKKKEQPEASFIEAEASKSKKVSLPKKRWLLFAPLALVVLIMMYAGYAIFLTPHGFMGIGAKEDGAVTPTAQSDEKVQLTPELLQDLGQKYDQAMLLAKVDRYPSYQKALGLLKEVQKIYPNHPKAASGLVELMIMGNRGYMTVEQVSTLVQSMRIAERVSPNTPETLRAKIRQLMLQDKNEEALARLNQLQNIAGEDIATMLLEAEVYLETQELAKAKEKLDVVLEKEPDHIRAHYVLAQYFFDKQLWTNVIKETKPLVENQHWPSIVLQAQAHYQTKAYQQAKTTLEGLLAANEDKLSPKMYGRAHKILSDIYLLHEKDREKGIALLEKAVAKVSLNDVYAKQLGDLYLEDENYTKAAQYYGLARNIQKTNIDYAIAHGQVLRLSGKPKEAVDILKAVVTKAPNREDGVLEYAKSRVALNQFDEVQSYLTNVVETNPSFIETMVLLGDIHLQKNELDQAQEVYKKALAKAKTNRLKAMANYALGVLHTKKEKWPMSQKYLVTANQQMPNQTDTLFMLGKVYYAQNQYTQAQKFIERSLNQDADNLEAKGMLASIYFEKGKQQEAIDLIEKVLEQAPKNIELRIMYGRILLAQGRFGDALDQMDEAYLIDAERYDVHFYLGIAEREMGQTDLSIRSLNRALTIWPESAKAYYQRGLTYIRKNEIDNAIKDMQKATDLSKKWSEPYQAVAQYYFDVALYEKSLEFYKKADAINKNDRQSNFQMAKAYFQRGQPQEALDLLSAMTKQYPSYAPAYHEIGVILEEGGDFQNAFKYYQRATKIDPNFAESYQRMGFVYKNFDQKNNAVAMFKKYLALRPNAMDREDMEEEIARLEFVRP